MREKAEEGREVVNVYVIPVGETVADDGRFLALEGDLRQFVYLATAP